MRRAERMRKKLKSAAVKTAAGRKLVAVYTTRANRLPKVERLVRTGLIDVEWYSALSGEPLADAHAAATHYTDIGRKLGLTVNPLLDPHWPPGQSAPKKGGGLVVDYLRGRLKVRAHPLFDQWAYERAHPAAADHPGRAIGHFYAHVDPSSPFPFDEHPTLASTTWSQWRAGMIAWATEYGRALSLGLTAPRVRDDWDAAADAAYIARWSIGGAPALEPGLPVVSVVMPVRNRPELVAEAIRSVQAQTMRAWELVVVDDGSTDSTPDVVSALAADDPRIVLVREEQSGVCVARNTGIENARGRYVAFLDSDNVWLPQFLEVATSAMHAAGDRAGYAAIRIERGDDITYRGFEGGRDHLLVVNHIPLISVVVETDLLRDIGGFDPALRRWVDHDLVLRLSERTPLAYLPFVSAVVDENPTHTDRITATEGEGWGYVVLQKNTIDWDALGDAVDQRVSDRVSVLIPTFQDWRMTVEAVVAVLDAGDEDVEVVVLDNGSVRNVGAMLQARLGYDERIRLVRVPRNAQFAMGSNLAFAASTGRTVVFLNNDTLVRKGWLQPLLRELEEPGVTGVQPLLLYPDGTVQCAGVWFPGDDALPSHYLAHHPADDARKLGSIPVRAVTAAAVAMRAEAVIGAHGFDPMFINGWEDVDLCLRLGEGAPAPVFRVVTDSEVVHLESKTPGRGKFIAENRRIFHDRWKGRLLDSDRALWERRGFEVAALDTFGQEEMGELAAPRAIIVRRPVTTDEGLPRLRWAIKIGAGVGPLGDVWGDTHFAADLAAALERLGQDVVVDRREAFYRRTGYLDDVTLTLRGLSEVKPQPGRVNLLWVISHPDIVAVDELRRFDRSFAASITWAERMSAEAGVEVEPLLQATNPAIFNPGRATDDPATAHGVLFVGNARGATHAPVSRPAVDAAIAEGVDLTVYGLRWDGLIEPRFHGGDYVANEELGAFYASAQVLLCDHHADMAAEGFAANRLFDAVASGTRVVSDRVAGAEDVFGPLVQWYAEPGDLRRLLVDEREQSFLGEQERREAAARFGQDHSFDARARVLLERAAELHQRSRAR